jgi:hypothetical protein
MQSQPIDQYDVRRRSDIVRSTTLSSEWSNNVVVVELIIVHSFSAHYRPTGIQNVSTKWRGGKILYYIPTRTPIAYRYIPLPGDFFFLTCMSIASCVYFPNQNRNPGPNPILALGPNPNPDPNYNPNPSPTINPLFTSFYWMDILVRNPYWLGKKNGCPDAIFSSCDQVCTLHSHWLISVAIASKTVGDWIWFIYTQLKYEIKRHWVAMASRIANNLLSASEHGDTSMVRVSLFNQCNLRGGGGGGGFRLC